MAAPDLRSDTACLVKVARAFAELQYGEYPARGEVPEGRPDNLAMPCMPAAHSFVQDRYRHLDGGEVARER